MPRRSGFKWRPSVATGGRADGGRVDGVWCVPAERRRAYLGWARG